MCDFLQILNVLMKTPDTIILSLLPSFSALISSPAQKENSPLWKGHGGELTPLTEFSACPDKPVTTGVTPTGSFVGGNEIA